MFFNSLTLGIARRYSFSGGRHRFASFVALLSTLGITIGVCALIVVSSIMQGLQTNLKNTILSDTPQVVVEAEAEKTVTLLTLPGVTAAAPFVEGQALIQSENGIELINLQGIDIKSVQYAEKAPSRPYFDDLPQDGSFTLKADAALFYKAELSMGQRVRLISTQNARYTPMGLTPTQRVFTLTDYIPSLRSSQTYNVIGSYADVLKLFRLPEGSGKIRLWLADPFAVETTAGALQKAGFTFYDWRQSLGEFFKAVSLEKLTMSLMLFLIVVVAAFNILSALAMMVSARLKEIAILKTLGMTSGKILTVFLIMGLSCGIIGCILGVILGIPLALNSGHILQAVGLNIGGGGRLPVEIGVFNTLAVITGCLLMSLLCAIYPALKAAKTPPAQHLTQN